MSNTLMFAAKVGSMIGMQPVDLVGIQLDANSGASVLLLRERSAPHRLLPIVIGGAEAVSIAIAASGQHPPRPLTHDLMAAIVERLDAHVDAVEVTELRDGSFHANLAVSGPTGEQRLDTRPSDAIALALRLHAPLFVSDQVLDEAGAVPAPELDEETIDAQVADFRSFLADLEPADFDAGGSDAERPPEEP